MKPQVAITTVFLVTLGSFAAAQSGVPGASPSAAVSVSTSYNDPVFGNHVGAVPKGWPPPSGDACKNTPEDIEDAHTVHALGMTALNRNLPYEALFYWRLAYVESCNTPKILVNVAIAAEQAGDIRGAIEALELYEARGALRESDLVANHLKLVELRQTLPKPATSASALTSASASASASASTTLVDQPLGGQRKNPTPWVGITGFTLAGLGLASGLTFQLWGNFEHNSVASNCHQGICPPGTSFDTLNTTRTLSYVGYGVGIVGLGIGILGLTVFKSSGESPHAVSLVFTGNGLSLSGRF